MRFRERPPHPALAADVECLWSIDAGPAVQPAVVFPDGCLELVFHLGGRFVSWPEGGGAAVQPEACLVGQLSRPFWLRPEPGAATIGARFRPGGAYRYFGSDLDSCTDAVVSLEDLWGEAARDCTTRLAALDSDRSRWACLESWLRARASQGRALHPRTRAALDAILASRGRARIDGTARAAGWTARHLERRFAREVGIGPKRFARTVRFQTVCASLGSAGGDWAGVAWECGFADQAHLIREFRRFTGTTPLGLQGAALDLAQRFVSPARLAVYFAAVPGRSDSFYRSNADAP